MTLIDERTCDRCARLTSTWKTIDDAYICDDCQAEIAAEQAQIETLHRQLAEAEDTADHLLHGICDALAPGAPTEAILRALIRGTEHERHVEQSRGGHGV